MEPSNACLKLVAEFEGCRLKAYPDPGTGGVPWTIGYGHTKGVKKGDTCTQEQADEWLRTELVEFGHGVSKLVTFPINQQMFDALVSFAYNLGLGNLKSSTLLKKLNEGLIKDAADQFPRWNRANGQVMNGLTRRRNAERALFLSDGTHV